MKKSVIPILFVLTLWGNCLLAQTDSVPPGIIINYIPGSTGKYIGSPSICILPNGDYIASHDEFGPKSTEYKSAQTLIFKSSDKGKSWAKISQINGQFWSNLFLLKGDLYIMGTNKAHGNVVLRKSIDNGKTWTNPYNADNGLILEGEYHTAPTPLLVHNGRVWRAVEYATAQSDKWGERYSAVMLSAPVKSDLLKAKNWTRSNHIGFDKTLLDGNFKAWLEGNAVVGRNGEVLNLLRVHIPPTLDEYTALIKVNKNGKKLTFNKEDFYKMPGASKKFTIRYDDKSQLYWTIVNYIPDSYKGKANPDRIRNFVAVATSTNLTEWKVNKILFYHPDNKKHGFQYIDWVVEGEDIIFVSRTAYDDKEGGANDYHNANYLTFHRINNFKDLSRLSVNE